MPSPSTHCVYTHSLDGVVFYVGHGTFERPYVRGKRNKAWSAMVRGNGGLFQVEIERCFETLSEAVDLERRLIEYYKPAANPKLGGPRPGAGRPRNDEPRCSCDAMSERRALRIRHKCKILKEKV